MTDPEMIGFTGKSLLGGVSGFFVPLPIANNPQTGEEYNPKKPHVTIVYLDACNLY